MDVYGIGFTAFHICSLKTMIALSKQYKAVEVSGSPSPTVIRPSCLSPKFSPWAAISLGGQGPRIQRPAEVTEMDLGMSESGGTQLWNLMHTTVINSCNFPKVSKLLAGILVGIDHFETSICTFSPRIQCEQRRKKAPYCHLWKFRNAEDRSLQIFI